MKSKLFFLLLFFQCVVYAQDSLGIHEPTKQRYVVGFIPSSAANIYGLAIGPIGSEAICNRYYTKKSHGINIQLLGQGFFTPFFIFNDAMNYSKTKNDSITYGDSTEIKRVVHNGLLIAGLGTFSEDINGVSISPWMSINHSVNGLSLNALVNNIHTMKGVTVGVYNSTYKTNGLQIGLINKTQHLVGFQLGLWNVNKKRKLPFVNWSFKD